MVLNVSLFAAFLLEVGNDFSACRRRVGCGNGGLQGLATTWVWVFLANEIHPVNRSPPLGTFS